MQSPSDAEVLAARRAVQAAPERAASWFRLCSVLLQRGEAEANDLGAKLQNFSDYAPGWCEIGGVLLHKRQMQAAKISFERAIAAAPGLAAAHTGRGRCLRALGDTAGAIAAFGTSVSLDPAQVEAWFGLGNLHQDERDYDAAAAAYRAALQARPGLHEAAFNLGVVLLESGQLAPALAGFSLAWQARPDSFGRIAQALASSATGCIWLDPDRLRQTLLETASALGAEGLPVVVRACE